mmetsp:Transcript_20356/g.31090  ORF Transcript_20356/g.31090 Transcript_20356/m.31090 type:complete len:202 (+) Transcript_20356:1438-2043(+)
MVFLLLLSLAGVSLDEIFGYLRVALSHHSHFRVVQQLGGSLVCQVYRRSFSGRGPGTTWLDEGSATGCFVDDAFLLLLRKVEELLLVLEEATDLVDLVRILPLQLVEISRHVLESDKRLVDCVEVEQAWLSLRLERSSLATWRPPQFGRSNRCKSASLVRFKRLVLLSRGSRPVLLARLNSLVLHYLPSCLASVGTRVFRL